MKLELKHIQHYPMFGENPLKIQVSRENGKDIISLSPSQFYLLNEGYHFDDFKPLLHLLSDLYKEIDGVVHIVELAKIAANSFGIDFDVKYISQHSPTTYSVYGNEFGYTGLEFYLLDDEGDSIEINQLELFDYLFSHHFDVYGLIDKGLAININDLK